MSLAMVAASAQNAADSRIDSLITVADNGDIDAQKTLGWIYMSGDGVDLDVNEAVKWYEKAASQNDAASCYWLGFIYEIMLPSDSETSNKTLNWYLKGAQLGHPVSQYRAAWKYLGTDSSIPADMDEAVKWLKKSAEQGYPDALNELGDLYYDGNGVEANLSKAVECYTKAADKNNPRAMRTLALMYYQGDGVAQDMVKAFELWNEVKDIPGGATGSVHYNLGCCYEYGEGVGKNLQMAIKHYKAGAEAYSSECEEALRRLGVR